MVFNLIINKVLVLDLILMYINFFFVFYTRNPIYSIVFLMLAFFNLTIFLLYLGVEFFALLILLIYIGAISILFLFVIMMIDIKDVLLTKNRNSTLLVVIFLFLVLLIVYLLLFLVISKNLVWINLYTEWCDFLLEFDLLGLSHVLYTAYFYYLALIGLILLITMVGCISLVLEENIVSKKQVPFKQIRGVEDFKFYINE